MTMIEMRTAEWICSKCGATNRKLVAEGVAETRDRCLTCRTRHVLRQDERPVRWRATVKS
jgi:hypothetical protein